MYLDFREQWEEIAGQRLDFILIAIGSKMEGLKQGCEIMILKEHSGYCVERGLRGASVNEGDSCEAVVTVQMKDDDNLIKDGS